MMADVRLSRPSTAGSSSSSSMLTMMRGGGAPLLGTGMAAAALHPQRQASGLVPWGFAPSSSSSSAGSATGGPSRPATTSASAVPHPSAAATQDYARRSMEPALAVPAPAGPDGAPAALATAIDDLVDERDHVRQLSAQAVRPCAQSIHPFQLALALTLHGPIARVGCVPGRGTAPRRRGRVWSPRADDVAGRRVGRGVPRCAERAAAQGHLAVPVRSRSRPRCRSS